MGLGAFFISLLLVFCAQQTNLVSTLHLSGKPMNLEPDAKSCGFSLNVRKQRVSWKERTGFYLDRSCPASFRPYVLDAINVWNSILNRRGEKEVFYFAGETEGTPAPKNDDGKNIISCGEITMEGAQYKQAITSLRWVGRDIVNADILIDTKRFYFAAIGESELMTQTEGQGGPVDLPSILTHELGHALGLEHSADEESVMYPTLRYGQERREIAKFDVRNAACEYE